MADQRALPCRLLIFKELPWKLNTLFSWFKCNCSFGASQLIYGRQSQFATFCSRPTSKAPRAFERLCWDGVALNSLFYWRLSDVLQERRASALLFQALCFLVVICVWRNKGERGAEWSRRSLERSFLHLSSQSFLRNVYKDTRCYNPEDRRYIGTPFRAMIAQHVTRAV